MKVNTIYNARDFQPEKLTEDSITVPDMALSVRDIIERFTRGNLEIPPVEYGEDEDIDAPMDSIEDLVDAQNIINDINYKVAKKVRENKAKNENRLESDTASKGEAGANSEANKTDLSE